VTYRTLFKFAVLLPGLLAALTSPSRGELASSYDAPDSAFASNTVVDIIEHNGAVWCATGEGLNFSYDSGRTWLLYNSSNGLVSENISALFSIKGRIWTGTNHDVSIGGDLQTWSDGVSLSDDNGQTWTQVDFPSLGFTDPDSVGLWGVNRTVYDIAGYYDPDDVYAHDDWLFFSAFASGFMASRDGGQNWRRIFASKSLENDFYANPSYPAYSNRYFSCAADTSHGDSLYVWVGTAAGVFQYVYAIPRQKAYANQYVSRVAFNDDVTGDEDNYVFYAGDLGVTRGFKTGGPYMSRFADGDPNGPNDGLPGPFISAVHVFRGVAFAGANQSRGVSAGLAVSTDLGESYQAQDLFTEVIGPDRTISDFASIGERLYMAAEEAGLWVSADTGQTWGRLLFDADTTAANRRNVVHAVHTRADTLRLGTDSGLVTLYLDPAGAIDSSWNYVFPEDDSSSTKVMRVKVEEFLNSADTTFDSLCVWTINWPLTDQGEYCVMRSIGDDDRQFSDNRSQIGVVSYDINFFSDSVFVATSAGVRFSRDGENGIRNQTFIHEIKDPGGTSATAMTNDTITVFEVLGDTVVVGSTKGFAVSTDRGVSYDINRINRDTLGADAVISYTKTNTGSAITGDFIPALGVQYIDGDYARIWSSNNPNDLTYGAPGISVGVVVPLVDTETSDTVGYVRSWATAYHGGFAWNFAFNGDTIFAATDAGLLINHAQLGSEWDTVSLVNNDGITLVEPGTPVYAAEVIGNHLWIGTGDRTVRMNVVGLGDAETFYFIDSASAADVVYAFPAPFSFSRHAGIDFHFTVEQDANITIEIYDFAMNLVRRIVDNRLYPKGIYPTVGSFRPTWDGYNGQAEKVAVGMYHFKVEYSTGEVRWGKLAVIP